MILPRGERRQPRWGVLYLSFAVIGLAGTMVHFVVDEPILRQLVDIGFALAMFVALAAWVHDNRIALATLDDDPRPRRDCVVPSGKRAESARHDDRVVRLDADERIILPYNFD